MPNLPVFAVRLLFFAALINSVCCDANCTVLRDVFANFASEFTSCAIQNSKPITLCESCVEPYISLVDSYDNMTKFSEEGVPCIDRFVNVDRLGIVQSLYADGHNLWNRAKCSQCFQVDNGTLRPVKSNETVTFNGYLATWRSCANRTTNDTILCETCMKDYLALTDYYSSISNENERIGACMDIVDLMNDTRYFWSAKCCKYRRHNEYIFKLAVTMAFLTAPLFYILAKLCSEKEAPVIIQQTRFAESLNQPNHS